MANKVTQKELYERIKAHMADDAEVVALCDKKIEQIANKAKSANSKKDEANEKMFDAIAEVLNGSEGMRASEVHKALFADMPDITIQRITSLLHKMVERGEVVKSVEKKVSKFSLAPADGGED